MYDEADEGVGQPRLPFAMLPQPVHKGGSLETLKDYYRVGLDSLSDFFAFSTIPKSTVRPSREMV